MSRRGRSNGGGYGSSLMEEAAEWLARQALADTSVSVLFIGCCERMLAAGVPLRRAYFGDRTLHPMFESVSPVWKNGSGEGNVEHAPTRRPSPARSG